MSTSSAVRSTVIEQHQENWPVTVQNAIAYLEFAVEHKIPRAQLHSEPFMIRILKQCFRSKKFFAQVFMSDSFKKPMTHQHDGFWKVLDDDTIPKTALCCWRSFGKSAGIIGMAVWSICFQMEKFILVVGKSHDHASTITENIKLELFCNRKIRAVFGTFRQRKAEEMEGADAIDFDLMFSRRGWFACDPETGEPVCFVMPKGVNQQVRGLNVRIGDKMWRVTLGIIDDLEDIDELENEHLRKKTRKWFFGDLLPVVDDEQPVAIGVNRGRWNLANGRRPPWRWIYIDTLKHEDSLMALLIDSKSGWRAKVYPQSELRQDADGKRRFYSLVPERISHAQVREEVRQAIHVGGMNEYCREKMCLPINPINAAWTKDSFQRYHERELNLSRMENIRRLVIVDSARTAEATSCPTGMLAFGLNTSEHKIWIRAEVNERIQIEDIPDRAIDLCLKTNSRTLCVETDGADDYIRNDFREAIAKRGVPINLVFLSAKKKAVEGDFGTGRDARKRRDAQGALRWYKTKQIWHEHSLRDGPLEAQQLSFPNPTNWDSLDCLGHLKRAMNELEIYFEYKENTTGERFEEDDLILSEFEQHRRMYNDRRSEHYKEISEYMEFVAA